MPENVRDPCIEDHVIIKRPQCGNGPRDTPITSQEASNDQGIPRDQMSVDINWERLTTVDEVCTAVCGWLESVTQEERPAECVTDQ